MKKEHAQRAIDLHNKINFAEAQIGAVESFMKDLKMRDDVKNTLRIDLTCYFRENIVVSRFAVPIELLMLNKGEIIDYWKNERNKAEEELESL